MISGYASYVTYGNLMIISILYQQEMPGRLPVAGGNLGPRKVGCPTYQRLRRAPAETTSRGRRGPDVREQQQGE